MKTQKFKLPILVEADDYHTFYFLQDFLKDLTGNNKIKVAELVFRDDEYSNDQPMIYYKKKLHRVPEESPINDSIVGRSLCVVYDGKQPDIKDIFKSQLVVWE
jgi:hypothetical protein